MTRAPAALALRLLSRVMPLLLVAFAMLPRLAAAEPADAAAQAATANVVASANAFLATLDAQQRAAVLYAFDDDRQRARWSNFPTGFVPRGGVRMADLGEAQRAALATLLATALSKRGYAKVEQMRDADDAFKALSRDPRMFGKDLYYVSFLGTPSASEPWMLQFGGHHLALNLTIAGGRGVLTPSLTGAQPGTYQVDGRTVRPLGQENDKGFALINALDDAQRTQAVLGYRVADLVLGPDHDGQTIQPEGLKASAMDARQRALLLDLIAEWAGIVNDGYAAARMAEITAGLDDTWFAWSGPTTVAAGANGASYYRIQGPKLVIEYAPQPGEDHVHTIYRDPTADYGRAPARK